MTFMRDMLAIHKAADASVEKNVCKGVLGCFCLFLGGQYSCMFCFSKRLVFLCFM